MKKILKFILKINLKTEKIKKGKDQISNIGNETEYITTDPASIKSAVMELS
jgi:hypothetical protein